jgi:hypothetical protein
VESETERLAASLRGFNREVKRNTLLLADTAADAAKKKNDGKHAANQASMKGYKRKAAKKSNPKESKKSKQAVGKKKKGGEKEREPDNFVFVKHMVENDVFWVFMDTLMGEGEIDDDSPENERYWWVTPEAVVVDNQGERLKEYVKKNCDGPVRESTIKTIDDCMKDSVDQSEEGEGTGSDDSSEGEEDDKASADEDDIGGIEEERRDHDSFESKQEVRCDHDCFELDITYEAEGLASFCAEGNYLHGVECGLCAKGFVADGSSGFRPSGENPIYCCVHFKGRNAKQTAGVKKCKHAICASCWRKRIQSTESPSTGRSSRRKRTGGGG